MTVPHDLPVYYYALYAIQKVHFIITLVSLVLISPGVLAPRMSVITRLQCSRVKDGTTVSVLLKNVREYRPTPDLLLFIQQKGNSLDKLHHTRSVA